MHQYIYDHFYQNFYHEEAHSSSPLISAMSLLVNETLCHLVRSGFFFTLSKSSIAQRRQIDQTFALQ
jgi:hypothetical protein